MSLRFPTDLARFETFSTRLFGEEAAQGQFHTKHPLSSGLTLTVAPDSRTAEQLVAQVFMAPPDTADDVAPRLLTQVPVSLQMGSVYIDAVRAALTRRQELVEEAEAEGEEPDFSPWNLDYTSTSANGGRLKLSVAMDRTGSTMLTVENENPHTSLKAGQVNTAARSGEPFENVSGTVWFTLGRDEFDFFSRRAYGIGQGAEQNFRDFQLLPHDWLRLTVTPQYNLGMVDVGFEIVTVDDRRVQVAKAPASYVAGEQFQQNVLRMVDDMNAAEAQAPGSAPGFTAPFHYEDPQGGGVVKVIAQGDSGVFRIAYFVESPAYFLEEVDFVPLLGHVDIPDNAGVPDQGCPEEDRADVGRFVATFAASSTVVDSPTLKAPLQGPVWGSVFHASDVTLLGPNEGAEAVASFHFPDVDVRDPAALRSFEIAADLDAGNYQILGFMDIDGNADPDDASPDTGDPVMIPIGGYPLECNLQPVTVEFAITLPEDY